MQNIDLSQLSDLLAPILNDPEAMAGISAAAAGLGLSDLLPGNLAPGGQGAQEEQEVPNMPHAPGVGSPVQTVPPSTPGAGSAPGGVSGDLGDMLGRLMPLLAGGGGQDDNTRLLSALRPFLHGGRAKRLEDAERMVKLLGIVTTLHTGKEYCEAER